MQQTQLSQLSQQLREIKMQRDETLGQVFRLTFAPSLTISFLLTSTFSPSLPLPLSVLPFLLPSDSVSLSSALLLRLIVDSLSLSDMCVLLSLSNRFILRSTVLISL